MRNFKHPNRASALILTMIAIGILTAIAAASMQRSTNDTSIAGKSSKRALAMEAAEGGMQRIAQKVLYTYNNSASNPKNFNTLLGSSQTGTSNGGQFSVLIFDNNNVGGVNQDGDGSATTDSDGIFRLVSTGKVGPSEQVTEAYYKITAGSSSVTWPPSPTGCPSPPCNSAALLCGASNVSRGGSSQLDGSDFPYPTYGCNGSHCNVSAISGTTGNYDVIGDSTVSVSGSGVTSLANQGSSAGCSGWQSFYDQWANVSPTAPGVVHITGSSYGTSNSCSSPKIFLIDTASATLSLTSNTYLCGTFIFKSNTTVSSAGTMTMVGAILLMGDYPTNAFSPATGTSNILGKVILRSTASDAGVEVGIGGSGKILYSSAGMDAALQALTNANTSASNGSMQLVSWRTRDK